MFIALHSLDQFILEFINLSYHNIYLDNLSLIISYGGVLFTWLLIAGLLYLSGNEKEKKLSKKMIIGLVLITLTTQILKLVIMRPRPYTELSSLIVLATENDYSFPSGHTSTSTVMTYILYKEYDEIVLWIIPLLIALSRLYIGVHYPSDIIGGFVLGLIIGYIVEYYLNFKNLKY